MADLTGGQENVTSHESDFLCPTYSLLGYTNKQIKNQNKQKTKANKQTKTTALGKVITGLISM